MSFIKKTWSTILLSLIFLVGLCLLLYPSVSDYWNSFTQSHAIASYSENVANIDSEDMTKMLEEAQRYNEALAKNSGRWIMDEKEEEEYNSILNINNTGIIGYIEISKIKCSLPIYHGTDEAVLQKAVGHIPGSSFPIGGKSTHAVLSGHRGLPSAKLFTDLDKLQEGDTFVIRVLDEIYTYEVDQILIVEPDDISSLNIVEGQELCTLVTCTPYGVNTHRLLVRGHRISNEITADDIRVVADAIQIEPRIVAPLIAIPILLIIVILIFILPKKKKRS